MKRISRRARPEFSQLPWMIAKTAGGLAAALGGLAAAWTLTHSPQVNPWPTLILALAGFLLFIGADRVLAKRADTANRPVASTRRASVLSWLLLVLLAAGFLLFVHFITL
jgi:zinc transporter ZupT